MNRAVVIESDPTARKAVKDILANEGIEVLEAVDGQKGITAVRGLEDLIAIFIGDRLTGLSGSDTLIGIRKFQPRTPVIMLMSGDDRKASQVALSRGANWFLQKPVRVEDVLAIAGTLRERARLVETAQSQIKRLQLLEKQAAELTTLGSGAMVPGQIIQDDSFLKRTIDLISEVLDAKKISLMLLDEERNELFMAHSNWILPSKLPKIRQPINSGVAGKVIREGKPRLVTDSRKVPKDEANEYSLQYESSSFICTPLFHQGKAIGTISANDKRSKEPFTESDLAILNTFAHQISMVISNLAMTHQVEVERDRIGFVTDTVHAVLGSLDDREIFQSLLEKVRARFRATGGAVLVYHAREGNVLYEAVSPEAEIALPTEPVAAGAGALARALKKGQVVIVNGAKNASEVDKDSDFPRGLERRSIAVAPLRSDGKTLGALVLYNKAGNEPFDSLDRDLLETIAPHASLALKQAWLYQSLIKSIDEVAEANRQIEQADRQIKDQEEQIARMRKKVSP